MRRLVFITQQVDPGHPALAATVPKLAALASRVDELVVLADGAVPGVLPANCRVRPFRAPGRLGRGLRFEAALIRELSPRPQAVVAHMCPIYAVLSAPIARPLGIRVLLWYTHWNATRTLRLAERLVTDVVSVDRRSFPLGSRKVTATGHGVDLSEHSCREAGQGEGFRLLGLGRYSPAKGLETVLRGLRLAIDQGLDARLVLHGPALSAEERGHRAELDRLVSELGLEARVRLGHAVLRAELAPLFQRADVLVNNMRAGAPDKAVYEACGSCLPVLASNPSFDDLFAGVEPRLAFKRDSPNELAARLRALAALPAEKRAAIGRTLRERAVASHSVDSWAAGVLAVAEKR